MTTNSPRQAKMRIKANHGNLRVVYVDLDTRYFKGKQESHDLRRIKGLIIWDMGGKEYDKRVNPEKFF